MKINTYLQQEEAENVTKRASMKFENDLILAVFITAFSLLLAINSQVVCADGAFVLGANSVSSETIEGVDTIVTKSVSIPAGTDAAGLTWNCAVNCRAETTKSGAAAANGTLLLLDNGVIVPGSTQSFEMENLSPMAISTNAVTTVVKAAQPETLSCALQELSGNISINDASMSIVCTDLP